MSFWGIFGSGGSSNELPSAGSSAPPSPSKKQQAGPPPVTSAATAAAGPPPTANAYLHTPLHSPAQQPHAISRAPPAAAAAAAAATVPTFQIFTPEPDEAKNDAETNEETSDWREGAIIDPPAQQYTEPIIGSELEQEEVGSEVESASHQMGPTATATLHAADEKQPVIPASLEESDEDDSYEHDDDDDEDDESDEEEEDNWEWEDEVTDEEEREAVPANRRAQSTPPNDDEEEELVISTTSQQNQVGDTWNDHANIDLHPCNDASPATLIEILSPTKPSRFRFLQDESIPVPKLEEASTKRRHEFRSRMYEMDCHLAGIESLCVDEGLDRDAAHRQVFPNVCLQLEGISNRYLGNKLMMDEDKTRILTLQRRVSKIHGKLVQHKHDTMNVCLEDELESIGVELLQSVQPSMQMEASKADKRESTLFRKFDSLAGTVARRFQEESATRKAATALLEEQMAVNTMEQQHHFLEHLQKLRAGLREEREARKERDAKVLDDVHATCSALMRAVLEAAGEKK